LFRANSLAGANYAAASADGEDTIARGARQTSGVAGQAGLAATYR